MSGLRVYQASDANSTVCREKTGQPTTLMLRLFRKRFHYSPGLFRGQFLSKPILKRVHVGESLPLVGVVLMDNWVGINTMRNSKECVEL
jgi:hypothetical protein